MNQQKFTLGIATRYSVEDFLLYAGHKGAGLDSSWRHKNENVLPVTLAATANDVNHLRPGTCIKLHPY